MVFESRIPQRTVTFLIVCETEGCPNDGEVINRVSEIPVEEAERWLEDYLTSRSSEEEDYCPLCGQQGVAYEA